MARKYDQVFPDIGEIKTNSFILYGKYGLDDVDGNKHGGKFKELHTVGIAISDEEIEKLCVQGKAWINSYLGVRELDFDGQEKNKEERHTDEAILGMLRQD